MRYNEIATIVEKKRRKKKSHAYAGGWFYPGYSWVGDASGSGDGGGGESVVHENFYVDVPNEDWLQDKVDYAKSKPRNSFGVPFMGSTTAYVKNNVRVPVDILKQLPGMRGEQKNVRKDDLFAIMKIMKDTGKLPTLDNGEEYAPFINVAYNGEAWVNEGNHRIMAAAALGWKDLPVQISYFDGGERIESGAMYPAKIGLGNPLDENFADGKKPGRKGLAKRSGVNCKQSVSKLRTIAKNSSGEKQRMAHWCANMKSGKNESMTLDEGLEKYALVLALASALAGPAQAAEPSPGMEAVAKAISIGRQINNFKGYGREGLEAEAHQELKNIFRTINKEPGANSRVLPIIRDMAKQPADVPIPPVSTQTQPQPQAQQPANTATKHAPILNPDGRPSRRSAPR